MVLPTTSADMTQATTICPRCESIELLEPTLEGVAAAEQWFAEPNSPFVKKRRCQPSVLPYAMFTSSAESSTCRARAFARPSSGPAHAASEWAGRLRQQVGSGTLGRP